MPKRIKEYSNKDKARAYRNTQRRRNYDLGGFVQPVGAPRRLWKEGDMVLLVALVHKGFTYRQIGQILKRPVRGISMKIHRLRNRSTSKTAS